MLFFQYSFTPYKNEESESEKIKGSNIGHK